MADLTLRPEADDLFEKYRNSKGPRALFQKTDVTDWSQLRAAFDAAVKEFGQLDIVCPGAGTFEPVSLSPPTIRVREDLLCYSDANSQYSSNINAC